MLAVIVVVGFPGHWRNCGGHGGRFLSVHVNNGRLG